MSNSESKRPSGDAIRAARLAAGLKQRDAARLAGISFSHYQGLERGYVPKRGRAVEHVVAALTALGYPPS